MSTQEMFKAFLIENVEMFKAFLIENVEKEKTDLFEILKSIPPDGLPQSIVVRVRKIQELEASLKQHARKRTKKVHSEQPAEQLNID